MAIYSKALKERIEKATGFKLKVFQSADAVHDREWFWTVYKDGRRIMNGRGFWNPESARADGIVAMAAALVE